MSRLINTKHQLLWFCSKVCGQDGNKLQLITHQPNQRSCGSGVSAAHFLTLLVPPDSFLSFIRPCEKTWVTQKHDWQTQKNIIYYFLQEPCKSWSSKQKKSIKTRITATQFHPSEKQFKTLMHQGLDIKSLRRHDVRDVFLRQLPQRRNLPWKMNGWNLQPSPI